MIKLPNGAILVQNANELPNIPQDCVLYADFETSSGNPKLDSLNPWRDCKVYVFCVTFNDCPIAYCVPRTLPGFGQFVADCMRKCSQWVNHNVKYDMHVLMNDLHINPPKICVCTVARAKIVDSDRQYRGGYGLDALSEHWLQKDISHHEAKLAPYLDSNKDYGKIPLDIIAWYGTDDVLTNRELDIYIDANMPSESEQVAWTEVQVTRVLWKIEQRGLRVNIDELRAKELDIFLQLVGLDTELTNLAGRSFHPGTNADCFDVLCNQYGLPVLAWTNEGDETKPHNPSFDKNALKQYLSHPFAPHGLVKKILDFRELDQLNAKFVKPFQNHAIKGEDSEYRIHGTYNQTVTTGRSSCSEPNLQAMSKQAKKLFHPSDGCAYLATDLSQIEFRFIVHYLGNQECIQQYHSDPDTDYHQWIADICGIHRDPAKTANFRLAYGGGRKGLAKQLSRDMELVGSLGKQVEHLPVAERQEAFELLAVKRGGEVYDKYHQKLPELSRISYDVQRVCESRSFVRNLYGRRRYLPRKFARKAFNNLCQSGSADMFKEMIVAIDRFCEVTTGDAAGLVAQTHDEPLLEVPKDVLADPHFVNGIINIMQNPRIGLKVPIRCAVGISENNWFEASKFGAPPPINSKWDITGYDAKGYRISRK